MTERETEFKYLLSAQGFQRLTASLGPARSSRKLVNRYYVPREATSRRDWVLRLRLYEDGNELTLKLGREVEPGLFDSMEYSAKDVAEDPAGWEGLEPLQIFRREVSAAPLMVQGESVTHRQLYSPPVKAGKGWEVDRCQLPDQADFCELEIELAQGQEPESSRQLVESWLKTSGVEFEPSRKTKYARFLEAVSAGS